MAWKDSVSVRVGESQINAPLAWRDIQDTSPGRKCHDMWKISRFNANLTARPLVFALSLNLCLRLRREGGQLRPFFVCAFHRGTVGDERVGTLETGG